MKEKIQDGGFQEVFIFCEYFTTYTTHGYLIYIIGKVLNSASVH